jgi:hypothetical protein
MLVLFLSSSDNIKINNTNPLGSLVELIPKSGFTLSSSMMKIISYFGNCGLERDRIVDNAQKISKKITLQFI